jgi:hypothetical protein
LLHVLRVPTGNLKRSSKIGGIPKRKLERSTAARPPLVQITADK